ncbi:MAG: hypothetical protein GEU78_11150 [Actinobacteria bacterium]|nr:hypothetical protein [Actinomycetota bacterium]
MTTRAKHLIPTLLAITVLVAACGSPGSEGSDPASGGGLSGSPAGSDQGAGTTCPSPESDEAPDCPVSSTHDPIVVDPGDKARARPVDITPGLKNVYTTSFDDHRVVGGDRLKLFFSGGVEDCYGVDHVDIEYGNDVVIATIFYGSKPDIQACIDIAEYQVVTVQLDEPVGGRKIVDGSLAAT